MAKPEGQNRGRPHFGIVLVILGVLLLLQTMGIIPWSLWKTLIGYWPVILIITGLNIIMRHANPWLTGFITLLILAITILIAIWQNMEFSINLAAFPGLVPITSG